MTTPTPPRLPPALPPAVMKAIRKRLSRREMQVVETGFALRTTAQQVDNAITEWFAGTAGGPARAPILLLLLGAAGEAGAPQENLAAGRGVAAPRVRLFSAPLR